MAASLGWHTVEHSEGPTVLYLNYKGIRCRAIVLRLSASGVLLCSPLVAALKELLEESEGLGFPDVLGPYQELSLNLQAAGGKVSKRTVKALILDFDLAGVEHLTSALPDGVHDGIDNIIDPENDILFNSTMLYLVGLVARRVVRVWHFAPVCTTFGTLRRPRLRSKHQPFGFNPETADTRKGNLFAVRTALLLNLCLRYGLLCSVEQPASSVMYRLWMFQELLQHMFSIKFPFCSFGTPFQKGSWWLSNNPEMTKLASVCQCGYKGKHFAVRGTFTQDRLEEFKRRCRPSCFAVFDREPVLHEPVARFSGGYPRPLCDRVAMLNLFHVENSVDDFSCNIQRPISSPPMWIGEFGKCLKWKKVLQFRFRKRNHINIDENLAFRSLLKHLAKSRPGSRFCTFLDSRVVIGSSAKGRSSSQQLNCYMSTALPYLVGGDLYPHYLHIGTKENPADDLSRFVPLRNPDRALPTWLFELQQGNFDRFELIQSADSLLWPFSGWARLGLLLVFRDRCNPQECNATN